MARWKQSDAVRAAIVLCAILAIAALHYLTPAELDYWHYIFQRLFYLPVI